MNFHQKPGSSNLTGWKLEVGVAFYLAWQGLREKALLSVGKFLSKWFGFPFKKKSSVTGKNLLPQEANYFHLE